MRDEVLNTMKRSRWYSIDDITKEMNVSRNSVKTCLRNLDRWKAVEFKDIVEDKVRVRLYKRIEHEKETKN